MKLDCLFCGSTSNFNTIEHIIPESLGNDDLLLKEEVCDKCQNYFGKEVENYVLNKTPIGFWRTLLTIKNKHGNLPGLNFIKPDKNKGIFPDSHNKNDNILFQAHADFSTELVLEKSIYEYLDNEGKGQAKYVITPKVIHQIGRFLGKVGLELLCLNDRESARNKEYDLIRKYSRHGSVNEVWPLFHSQSGKIEDLFKYSKCNEGVKEDIVCYSYSLKRIENYVLFSLTVGIDQWTICLNEMFPSPIIKYGFPEQDLKLLWYSKEEWKK